MVITLRELWKEILLNPNWKKDASFNDLQLAINNALTEVRDAVLPVVSSFHADEWLNTPLNSRPALPHLSEEKVCWNCWGGFNLLYSTLPDILRPLNQTLIRKACSASLQDIKTAINQNPNNSFSTAENVGKLLQNALLSLNQLHALINKKSGLIWKPKTYLNPSDKTKWHRWLLFGDPFTYR